MTNDTPLRALASPRWRTASRALFTIFLTACLFAAFAPTNAQAQCQTVADGDFSNSAIWTNCGGGIPGSSDDVIISSGQTVGVDVNASINNLTIEGVPDFSTFTRLILDGADLTVNGNTTVEIVGILALASGTYAGNAYAGGDATLNGDLTVNGGLLRTTGQTLTFAGGVNQVVGGGSSLTGSSAIDIAIVENSTTLSAQTALEFATSLTTEAGSSIAADSDDITVSGSLVVNGTPGTIASPGTGLTIGAGTGIVSLTDDLTANGDITVADGAEINVETATSSISGATFVGGILNLLGTTTSSFILADVQVQSTGELDFGGSSGGDLGVTGNFESNGNIAFSDNARVIAFNGSSGQTINVPNTGASSNLPAVTLGGSTTVTLLAASRIEGNFTNTAGGTFNADGFSVNFNGAEAQNVDANASNTTLADVTVSNNTNGQFVNDLVVGGDLTIATNSTFSLNTTNQPNLEVEGTFIVQGTFDGTSGSRIVLRGDFSNADNSTFNSNGTELEFSGNALQIVSGGSNLTKINVDRVDVLGNNTTVDLDIELEVANDLNIDNGASVTLNNDGDPLDINSNLFIGSNGSLSLSPSAGGDLTVAGNFTNNGTFNTQGRKVTFDGAGTQQILGSFTGSSAFEELEIANSTATTGEVQIGSFVQVEVGVLRGGTYVGNLQLTEGELQIASSGILTFNSPNENEASRIDENGSGTISGNVRVRRTIGSAGITTGQFHMIASSIEGMVLDDAGQAGNENNWLSNILTQATGSGADLTANVPEESTVYTYNESGDLDGNPSTSPPSTSPGVIDDALQDAWTAVADLNAESVTRGEGYLVYIFPNNALSGGSSSYPHTIDAVGTLSDRENVADTNPVTISLTCTDNDGGCGSATDFDGWNLVGNPFQGYIDWLSPNITFNDMVETYWVWDADEGSYDIFQDDGTVSGVSTNGADRFIAPSQAFFVKATSSSGGSLVIQSSAKEVVSAEGDREFKSTTEVESFNFPIVVEGESLREETVFSFKRGTSAVRSGQDELDAQQMTPMSRSYAMIASRVPGNTTSTFDIQSLPAQNDSTVTLDLYIEVTDPGTYTLGSIAPEDLPANWEAILVDTVTGTEIDLYSGSTLTFTVDQPKTKSARLESESIGGVLSAPAHRVPQTQAKSLGIGSRFKIQFKGSSALPVEMGSFTGSTDGDRSAVLEWTTLSESNNAGFYVEQKVDGSFQTVSSLVEGAGTTTEQQSYRFRVDELEVGTTHTFRLRQVDVDGDKSYSDPIDVKLGIQEPYKLEAYPNPVQGGQQAKVRFAVDERQPVTIELYNTLGQRVQTIYNGAPRVVGEFQEVMVNANDLASGVYFVRMRGDSFATTQKLVVVR